MGVGRVRGGGLGGSEIFLNSTWDWGWAVTLCAVRVPAAVTDLAAAQSWRKFFDEGLERACPARVWPRAPLSVAQHTCVNFLKT